MGVVLVAFLTIAIPILILKITIRKKSIKSSVGPASMASSSVNQEWFEMGKKNKSLPNSNQNTFHKKKPYLAGKSGVNITYELGDLDDMLNIDPELDLELDSQPQLIYASGINCSLCYYQIPDSISASKPILILKAANCHQSKLEEANHNDYFAGFQVLRWKIIYFHSNYIVLRSLSIKQYMKWRNLCKTMVKFYIYPLLLYYHIKLQLECHPSSMKQYNKYMRILDYLKFHLFNLSNYCLLFLETNPNNNGTFHMASTLWRQRMTTVILIRIKVTRTWVTQVKNT
ncbi:hypothetical protein V2J09_004447 [Rumex salicifolius]